MSFQFHVFMIYFSHTCIKTCIKESKDDRGSVAKAVTAFGAIGGKNEFGKTFK